MPPAAPMRTIELFRLRRVRDKPRALALMAAHSGLSAAGAQAVLNCAIGGGRPPLRLPDDAAARDCIAALASAGFVARFASAPDFDAAQRAQVAVLGVLARLPSAVSDAVGACLLDGDWAPALDHALQHLRMHAPPGDQARALLERAALEVGLAVGVSGHA